ncbi:hypothetical protein LZ198_38000 [Myxococcus sp. K15C18031901]|uniref:hypothetical protein n=1 Tax=Myxococcus dinghuensis TaxID=2906761 RepID=UPI0020A703D7|nr:hypothetical protein [Myxococcus dinghuensis]MCP3104674.1 hypothetical protein [Myxococcus dinghuensis]
MRPVVAPAPPAQTPASRPASPAPGWRGSLAVFATAFVFLLALEALLRRPPSEGWRFQAWDSERMMQTLSLRELRDEPLRSLWYLHIQPPLLDVFRATLAQLHRSLDGAALVDAVDRWTYVAWAGVFALITMLVFRWVYRLAGRNVALVGAAVSTLHPAALAFATLLDGTLASAAAFLWFSYELWRFHRAEGSVARLAAASLVLFYLRSIFQWPFFALVALCLLAMRVPRGQVARYLGVTLLVAGPYVLKQQVLFGTPMTSTFDGLNFCRAIGMGEPDLGAVKLPPGALPTSLPSPSSAAVLRVEDKLGGHFNYNHLDYLRYSAGLKHVCRQALLARPVTATLASFVENAALYGQPSSRYQPNALVDRLPWREPLDVVFSWPVLAILGLALGIGAARRLEGRDAWLRAAGLVLPVLFVFTVSIMFEKGENMRFKYFLEPVLLVFFCAELSRLTSRVLSRPSVPTSAASDEPLAR